ncbi:hypothetical protein [Anaerostipes caccae]
MKEIQVFGNKEFGQIRAVTMNYKLWFTENQLKEEIYARTNGNEI